MFKRDHSPAVGLNHSEQSQRVSAAESGGRAGLRLARCALIATLLVLGGGLAGGCSDSLECKAVMPEGAVYKATILAETATSNKCHVVQATRMSPFQVTAGKTEPTTTRSDCSVTPAAGPLPADLDVAIDAPSCVPSETEMLGVYCGITYKAGCPGHMLSYFAAPANTNVNWSAAVIDNVLFRIQDFSPNCFSDQSNCLDEYTARLERVK
jgi:hypothetical protein